MIQGKDFIDARLDWLQKRGSQTNLPYPTRDELAAFYDGWHAARTEALEKSDMWWRDASRERPHRDRLVIAWTEKYGALLANRETSNPDFGWSCDGKVLFWMPLPELPETPVSPPREKT